MAITVTTLGSGLTTLNTTSKVTGSMNPSTGLHLAAIFQMQPTTNPSPVPTVQAFGLTWSQVNTVTADFGGQVRWRISLFNSSGGVPTTGASTILVSGTTNQDAIGWAFIECAGADTASPVVQSTFNVSSVSATALTVSLGGFASTQNLSYGIFGFRDNAPLTAGAGFTKLTGSTLNLNLGRSMTILTEDNTTGSTAVSARDGVNSAGLRLGIAAEIKASGVGIRNLVANVSGAASFTGKISPNKKLTLSISASAGLTPTPTLNRTPPFMGAIRASATMTAVLTKIGQAAVAIQASATFTATLSVSKTIAVRVKSTDVYDFTGTLRMSRDHKRLIRSFLNTSSPKVFQNVDVTTTPLTLTPDLNARFVLLRPSEGNTIPYRVVYPTDLISVPYDSTFAYDSSRLNYDGQIVGEDLNGFALSSVGVSVLPVSSSLVSFNLVTTVPATTMGVSVGYL